MRCRYVAGSGRLTVAGEGAETVALDASNLVARCFERAAPGELGNVDLHCVNRIPLARGLGSSTAAAACGLIAGWEWTSASWTADQLFRELADIDGHDDNAAACAHGGIVATHRRARRQAASGTNVVPHPTTSTSDADCPDAASDDDVVVLDFATPAWLTPVVIIPSRELATAEARAVLPASYDRLAAIAQVANAVALTCALTRDDQSLLRRVLDTDQLHEPQRAALVPELALVRDHLPDEALGATLSGAGPTVLAWASPASIDDVIAAVTPHVGDARVVALTVEPTGAALLA